MESADHDSQDAWLARDPLPADPMPIAVRWLEQAFAAGLQRNPHAIALATLDAEGAPAVRMVLCKALEPLPGGLVFYTDRASSKGSDLARLARAAAVFHFERQGRQLRVSGPIRPTSDEESDAYFASRPLDAQVGAWASSQSAPLETRATLEAEMQRVARRFGASLETGHCPEPIPRPANWGGYRLFAECLELWHSRPGRVHDRAEWRRTLVPRDAGVEAGPWSVRRLQP
jgi:pyridoxamine 5'-phosphate oxidase